MSKVGAQNVEEFQMMKGGKEKQVEKRANEKLGRETSAHGGQPATVQGRGENQVE